MARRRTILEACFPDTQDFAALAGAWPSDLIDQMLGFVWGAYDLLAKEVLAKIDCRNADKDLERSITMTLELRIRDLMSGYESFVVQHGRYEQETMLDPPAQPPQYDIAFVYRDNERVMWPLEAKVLRTDRTVAAYVADVKEQFLTCRYAPFVDSGAMLGYLLSGVPDNAFRSVAASLGCELQDYAAFGSRNHKASDHLRQVPDGKPYPIPFRCHHLMMELCLPSPKVRT